jgi:tetratricopeptide (TPR) repeat protein
MPDCRRVAPSLLTIALLCAALTLGLAAQEAPAGEPQARNQEELDAYLAAVGQQDLAAAESALDAFAAQHPESQLRASGYVQLMQRVQPLNKPEKLIALGRKALGFDPHNVLALVFTANALAENSDKAPDQNDRFEEALKHADAAIETIGAGGYVASLPEEQLARIKDALLITAYASKGLIYTKRDDSANAETALKEAVRLNRESPDPATLMRLAVAQDKLRKYRDALATVTAAIDAARAQKNTQLLAMAENHRLRLAALVAKESPAPAKKARSTKK